MSDSTNVTPELALAKVTKINNQDIITTEELFDLVKSLTILDEDNEVNLTKIGKIFGKEIRVWNRQKTVKEIITVLSQKSDSIKSANGLIREKMGGAGEQGTFTSSPELLLEFIRYCSPIIAVKMNSIVNELFTKGYTSIDNKERLTLAEHQVITLIWQEIQYKERCKDIILQAVQKIALDNNIEIPHAWNKFNLLSGYEKDMVDKDYESMCLVYGKKPLKSLSKFERTFEANPNKLIKVVVIALGIIYDIDISKILPSVYNYKSHFDICIVNDSISEGVIGIVRTPNQERLISKQQLELK